MFEQEQSLSSLANTLSKKERLQKSRKLTNELTSKAIKYLNDSGQFIVHRQNNIPSTRLSKKIIEVPGLYDKNGNPFPFSYEEITVSFKSNQKQFALLDIAGFTTGGSNPGIHLEIEVKRGTDRLKEDQADRIKQIRNNGGISFVFDSMETLMLQIKPYMKEKPLAF